MKSPEEIVEFIQSQLKSEVADTSWFCIDALPFVGRLAKKFTIYVRQRFLSDVIDLEANDFSKIESLRSIHKGQSGCVIAYDSEWVQYDISETRSGRFVTSWQFAFIVREFLVEVIFFPLQVKTRLDLQDALSVLYTCYSGDTNRAVDKRKLVKFQVSVKNADGIYEETEFPSYKSALAAVGGIDYKVREKFVSDSDVNIKICLVCHAGVGDISAFSDKKIMPLLRNISQIQKGMVSTQNTFMPVGLLDEKYIKHPFVYPIILMVRDTITQAPPGKKKLKDLGSFVGYEKVNINADTKWIDRIGDFLIAHPTEYFEYAATDSVVTLLYQASLVGINKILPMTLTSAGAKIMRERMGEYFGISNDSPLQFANEFNYVYRGLKKVKKGKVKNPAKMGVPYLSDSALEPINENVEIVQKISSYAYHGGFNTCGEIGYFPEVSWDYDIRSAYGCAMCLVEDLDYEQCVKTIIRNVSLDDIAAEFFSESRPVQNLLACVESFDFPEGVSYSNLCIMCDSIPVYPLHYKSNDTSCSDLGKVCVTGYELFLAHKLGAKAILSSVYVLSSKVKGAEVIDGNIVTVPSKSLGYAIKQFVVDRAKTTDKSLSNAVLKVLSCSGYGKVSQNVIEKQSWAAHLEEMTSIGCSSITNCTSAAMITALVRCLLIGVANQCIALGYKVYSMTTDGFISNVPKEILDGLDVYGFADLFKEARMFLTDGESDSVWQVKHAQKDLLNVNTRTNVSLRCEESIAPGGIYNSEAFDPDLCLVDSEGNLKPLNGVCAHGQAKCDLKIQGENGDIEYVEKDSLADRMWLMDKILTRTGRVTFTDTRWTTFREIVQLDRSGFKRDFITYPIEKSLSLNYDAKRKILAETLRTVTPVIAGKEYEICCASTAPYKDIAEYKKYRSLITTVSKETKRSPARALRTKYDWEEKFFKPLAKNEKIAVGKESNSRNRVFAVPRTVLINKAPSRASIVSLSTKGGGVNAKKVIRCLYAHMAGVITIPLLRDYGIEVFCKVLNKSKITKRRFYPEHFEGYRNRKRWPHELTSNDIYAVKHYVEEQEPVLSKLYKLQPPCEEEDF